jgi:signal transduction histidine kinase/CheY-like chemotaxis protein
MPGSGSVTGVLRFDLAVQRTHLLVYTLALITSLTGAALGAFPMQPSAALRLWFFACATSVGLYVLYWRGVDRRILNPVWIGIDVVLVTFSVYATGGISSPMYVWYVATSTAAAFAAGRRAAWIATASNSAAYIGMLLATNQIRFVDPLMSLALTRMLFVFGASYFCLRGIANLQEKRLRIRQLELEENRKVTELTDLTQKLAEANRRITEADRLKSQFLANMSHELRTPMNSIIGFSEILTERLDGQIDPKHVGFIRHIHDSGQHLLAIINDILDLSKIEAGKMEVYPEKFPVAPVVHSICQVIRGMARSVPMFSVEIPAGLPQIETDLAKFRQILFNLISNAVKFSPADKPITIRAAIEGDSLRMSVRDEGIGIDPAHHELIFQEFRQVDATARREFGGTGLGLALVRRFVELQGGKVTLRSALGEGSTFSFTLPLRSRAAVVRRTPQSGEPVLRGDRILVVEDDSNAWELLSAALGSAGFLPIRARHGDEALSMAREWRPAAITLDLVLPDMDGWDVLRQLKADEVTRSLPVVIVSMVENRDLGIALGADDYFVKPVDRDRLVDRIRQIATPPREEPRRLLVIDDDEAVHLQLGGELSALGYSLERAVTGEDGLRLAEQRTPDAIILDLNIPGMSGFEVAGKLKGNPRTANIPILVLTAKDVSRDERDQLHASIAGIVAKGSTAREQLVREIRRLTASGH